MRFNVAIKGYSKLKTQLLAVGVFEGGKIPSISSKVAKVVKEEEFKGKDGELCFARVDSDIKNVLLVGLGKKDKFDIDKLRNLSGKVNLVAKSKKIDEFSLEVFDIEDDIKVQATVEAILLSPYKFDKYKKKENKDKPVNSVSLLVDNVKSAKDSVNIAQAFCESVIFARDIANDPANKMTPTVLGSLAKKIASAGKMKCKVHGKKEIAKLKMNGLLAVSKGSAEEPKFIEMEYGSGKETIVLVGKGLTFDSGGISIKPGVKMDEMKYDMCGAAAVLGVMKALSLLKPKLHVVGLVAATENMPGGNAQKPGDLIKYSNGKTVEVSHTDAEGRLVLADALIYSKKFKPKALVDFATLTGACIIALGHHRAGLMSNSDSLCLKLELASRKSSEKVWRMPLDEEYSELLKGQVADLKNIGGWTGEAGTITAGCFLKEFVDCSDWAHLDIAGTAWDMKENSYIKKGATGFGVRLVAQMLMDWKG